MRSAADDVEIAYQTFLPRRSNGAAVVIIHGSGTSSRASPWYNHLVQKLLDRGYVVALPDKRGSDQSDGDWKSSSFETLAGDTTAVIHAVSDACSIPRGRVGIVGVSQGGQIAAIVANRHPDIGFAVSLVGSTTPIHDALKFEEENNLVEAGVPQFLASGIASLSSWSLRTFRQRQFWQAVGNFDPADYWKGVSVRSVVVLAELDKNTPSVESKERIDALGNPHVSSEVIPGVSHDLLVREEREEPQIHDRVLSVIDEVARAQ